MKSLIDLYAQENKIETAVLIAKLLYDAVGILEDLKIISNTNNIDIDKATFIWENFLNKYSKMLQFKTKIVPPANIRQIDNTTFVVYLEEKYSNGQAAPPRDCYTISLSQIDYKYITDFLKDLKEIRNSILGMYK